MLPSLWRRSAVGLGVPLRRRALVAVSSASALATAGSWALCESPADAPTMSPNPYRDGTVSQQQADAKAEYLRKAEYLENKTPEENTEALRVWRTHVHAAREHFGRKDYAAAEASLKEALEAAKVFGRDSGAYATSMLNLAQLYRRRGKLSDAVPLLESAIFVLESTAGPNNQVTVTAIVDLALTLLEQGQAADAKARFDDSLSRLDEARRRQTYGSAPAALMSVRADVLLQASQAERKLGQAAAAEAQLREALALVEERWGAESPKLVAPCTELARLLLAGERRDEARAMAARAASVAQHPRQRETLKQLLQSIG